MVTFLSRKKQFKEQVQRQFLSRWISSFVITTAIVVVAVVRPIILAITPAVAQFTNVTVVGDIISYQVSVSDPDTTLTPDSLVLEISNPFETIKESLTLGESHGTFVMNYPRYDYRLAIKASKGFGLETLDSEVVSANLDELSGAIASVHLDETIDPTTAFMLRYRTHILYSDPYQEVDTMTLWWGMLYPSELEIDPNAEPQFWNSIPILSTDSGVWLEEVYNENMIVVMKLVALNLNNEEKVLDEFQFMTPLFIYASVYISDVTQNAALASVYLDSELPIEVNFTLVLTSGDVVIETRDVILPTGQDPMQHGSMEFWFEGLNSSMTYRMSLYGDYLDPNSGENVHHELEHQTFTLSPPYQVDVVIAEGTMGFEVSVTVNDAEMVLSDLVWYMYQPQDDFDAYLDGGAFVTDFPNEPQRTYTGTIPYPQVIPYYVVIYATKTIGSVTYYTELDYFEATIMLTPTP